VITVGRLDTDAIRRHLTAEVVGRQIYLFGEVDSTNVRLASLARGGASEGTVVLAEHQTAGRLRRGDAWFSPDGVNLYASVLLRPRLPARQLGLFSLITSLAVSDVIKELGGQPAIKWPNDVLVGGRKVAGSLAEGGIRGEEVDYVVLGVGVNLNVDAAALAAALGPSGGFATSLAAALGHDIDRNAFTAAYLNHLDRWARRWDTEGPPPIVAAWKERDIVTGRRVAVRGPQGVVEGRAVGIDATGALVVRDTLDRSRTVTTEQVRILD
jgi:BirA family biotin operon repressor/biotin-[acetyl-CoA-carboxylase] ligase